MLIRLSHQLIQSKPNSPECWISQALCYEKRGDLKSAIKCLDKSIEIDERNVHALVFRGDLQTALKQYDEAISSYKLAHLVSNDISIFKGLVKCYLQIPKYKDAFTAAKMAYKLYPNSAKSYILLGMIYTNQMDGKDRAKKEFNKAIELATKDKDLESIEEAVLGIVDIDIKEQSYSHAIKL